MVKEGERTESDHVPLEVELEKQKIIVRKQEKMEKEVGRSNWTEEGIESYRRKCEGWTCTQIENENIWKELREKVQKQKNVQKQKGR